MISTMSYICTPRFNIPRYNFLTKISTLSRFKSQDLTINKPVDLSKFFPDPPDSVFGEQMSPFLLKIEWSKGRGWKAPVIEPVTDLKISAACKGLHYAQSIFEGLQAYRGSDGKSRIFRLLDHMERLLTSAKRAALPEFDKKELAECIRKLVKCNEPDIGNIDTGSALYIRPLMFGTQAEIGATPSTEAVLQVTCHPLHTRCSFDDQPLKLYADPRYVRCCHGGTGAFKMSANYAGSLRVQEIATEKGANMVLWLYGDDLEITELGAMNIFIVYRSQDGDKTILFTPALSDLVLPGITRRSVIDIARGKIMQENIGEVIVEEGKMTVRDVEYLTVQRRLVEVFGTGTAHGIVAAKSLLYNNHTISLRNQSLAKYKLSDKFAKLLLDIRAGRSSLYQEWNWPV